MSTFASRTRRLAVLVFLALVVLGGCTRTSAGTSTVKPFPYADDAPPSQQPATVDINFYLDTSGSMKGFLNEPPVHKPGSSGNSKAVSSAYQTNHFAELLQKAPSFLQVRWLPSPQGANPTISIKYWKFGTATPTKINDIRLYAAKDQYSDKTTHIQNAIKHQPPEVGPRQVKIIITDLFQSGEDQDLVAAALNTFLTDKNSALGIVGIRNPFYGNIDDLPKGGVIPAKGVDSLPFYALITGSVADVRHTIKLIENEMCNLGPEDEYFDVVFSERLTRNLRQQIAFGPGTRSGAGINSHDSMIPGAKQDNVPQFDMIRRPEVACSEQFFLDGESVSRVPGLVPQLHVKLWTWSKDKYNWVEVPDSSKSNMFSPHGQPVLPKEGQHTVLKDPGLNIKSDSLPGGTYYLVQYELTAQYDSAAARGGEETYSAWNMDPSDAIAAVRQGKFDEVNGKLSGKTLNLYSFLRLLSYNTFSSPVTLARYYVYLYVR